MQRIEILYFCRNILFTNARRYGFKILGEISQCYLVTYTPRSPKLDSWERDSHLHRRVIVDEICPSHVTRRNIKLDTHYITRRSHQRDISSECWNIRSTYGMINVMVYIGSIVTLYICIRVPLLRRLRLIGIGMAIVNLGRSSHYGVFLVNKD